MRIRGHRAIACAAVILGIGLWAAVAVADPVPPPESPAPRPPGQASPSRPVTVPHAEQFDVTSKANQTYRIFVAGPTGSPPAEGSPVVYVTDGNASFPIVVAAARRLQMGDSNAVVVGVGYPEDEVRTHQARRSFDLVGPPSEEALKELPPGRPAPRTGGHDQFLAFLEEELKPLIEGKHKIDRSRQTLFGHSFGGLFSLHVLFTRPETFQTYVASSPSIWWNEKAIAEEARHFAESPAAREGMRRLMITCGEWEESPGPTADPKRTPMLKARRMVTNARAMAERLQDLKRQNVTVLFKEFPQEDHGSVLLPAASQGMRFALE